MELKDKDLIFININGKRYFGEAQINSNNEVSVLNIKKFEEGDLVVVKITDKDRNIKRDSNRIYIYINSDDIG